MQLHHLGIEPDEAHLFQRLANRMLYADRDAAAVAGGAAPRARGGAPALWAHGISGDLPIVLVRIDDAEDQEIVRQLLRAHEYWRLKQLAVDLVIVNEQAASYVQELQAALETLVRASQSTARATARAARAACSSCAPTCSRRRDRLLLQTAARAVLLSRRGTLAEQVARVERAASPPPRGAPRAAPRGDAAPSRRRRARTSSSSTASAASPTTAAST